MTDLDLGLLVERGRVTGLIQDCAACRLSHRWNDFEPDDPPVAAHDPVPFRGPTPCPLMVLGESPDAIEDKLGRPFIGRDGKYLRRAFTEHHLPPLDEWFCANVVSCRSIGPPPGDAITACVPNLRAQVNLCDPDWVLTLGTTALAAVLPKAKITRVRGRPFFVPAGPFIGRWCFPTFHPAAALRDDAHDRHLQFDLSTLSNVLHGNLDREKIAARVGRGGKLFV